VIFAPGRHFSSRAKCLNEKLHQNSVFDFGSSDLQLLVLRQNLRAARKPAKNCPMNDNKKCNCGKELQLLIALQ